MLIADDHGVVREGIHRVCEAENDIKICAEACDGTEVLELVEKHHPDVVILDIAMPRVGGLEALVSLRSKHPDVKTLLLSFRSDAHVIQSAVSLGADGYLLKNAARGEIPAAIREVMRGGCYFSPPVAREIIDQLRAPRRPSDDPFSHLSGREREVLRLIAEGLSAKEIAALLKISTKTVEAHRTSLKRKLGARKATELVRYAVRHGFIEA